MDEEQKVSGYIIAFIETVDKCYRETSYVSDKPLYAADIAHAVSWVLQLRNGTSVKDVAQAICSPATSKHFIDYWKSGSWGDLESKALANLQSQVESASIK